MANVYWKTLEPFVLLVEIRRSGNSLEIVCIEGLVGGRLMLAETHSTPFNSTKERRKIFIRRP